jgi:glycosyltransferase involved in cell wall biosynthesis
VLLKKKILFIGGITGGGVATINSEVIEIFKSSEYIYYLIDTEKMKSKFPVPIAYFFSYIVLILKIIINKPEVVYLQIAQTGYLHQSLFLLIAKIFFRETIAHFHAKGDLKNTCTRFQFRKIIFSQKYTDKMVVLTESCKMSLLNSGWGKTIYVVPNFIDIENLPRNVKKIKERKEFLYIGRMHWQKGIFLILEIAEKLPGKKFIFVGNFSNDETKNKFLKKIEKVKNAEWLGPIYGNEKFDIIGKSKFLIFPTLWKGEVFPLTLIETGLLGCIPLVNPVGFIGEIIKDNYNGFYISPDNIDSIIDKINELNAREDLQKISDNAIDYARGNFTSEAVKDKLFKIVG